MLTSCSVIKKAKKYLYRFCKDISQFHFDLYEDKIIISNQTKSITIEKHQYCKCEIKKLMKIFQSEVLKVYHIKVKENKIDLLQSLNNTEIHKDFQIISIKTTQEHIEQLKNIHSEIIDYIEEEKIFKISPIKEELSLNYTNTNYFPRIGVDKNSVYSSGLTLSYTNNASPFVFVVDTGIYAEYNTISKKYNNPSLNIDTVLSKSFVSKTWVDDNDHGTHVSGIIGANGKNIIQGIIPNVKLIAIKVLDKDGSGYTSNIIRGLKYIRSLKNSFKNTPFVVNISLGGEYSQITNDAVSSLISSGIVVCVAAGNETMNASLTSPASTPNAITVGAYDSNSNPNTIASFSNYGSVVDILSPGVNIASLTRKNIIQRFSGTSMATPVITGIVALILNNPQNKSFTSTDIRNKLVNDSKNINTTYFNSTLKISNPSIQLSANAIDANTTTVGGFSGCF